MSTLRVSNATLVPMACDTTPINNAELIAVDGEITYAGPSAEAEDVDADTVIDAGGDCVLPGFINAHTHAAMTLLRGFADDLPLQEWLEEWIWPIEGSLEEDDVYWGTMLAILEMLAAGVTCYCDMYHFFEAGTRAAIDGGIRALPSGVLLRFMDDPDALMNHAVDFAVRMQEESPDRIIPMLGPHAPYSCTPQMLQNVAHEAARHDLGIHIHVSETADEVAEIKEKTGMRPVEYLDSVGVLENRVTAAHCVHINDEEVEMLVEGDVGVAHCPSANMKLASGFAPIDALLSGGARLGVGTDGTASNNRLDVLREANLAALLQKGYLDDPTVISAEEALRMATLGSAEALHIEDRVGSLEIGKRADFCIMSLDAPHNRPLHNICSQIIYAAGAHDVWCTVVDGEVLYRDGEYPTVEAEEIITRAEQAAQRLLSTFKKPQRRAST